MRNRYENGCPLSDEIVSYVYGEIAADAEENFETHLAGCMVCTDEFAAVSEARYSMFEWKKEAFDPLATPEILIPYRPPVAAVTWVTRMHAWAESLSIPVAVAALAVCVGIGFYLVGHNDNNEQSGASNVARPDSPAPSDLAVTALPGQAEAPALNKIEPTLKPRVVSASQRKRVVRRPDAAEKPSNSFAVAPRRATDVTKAPALTQYPDNDDNSLRLAELFDEVGG
jgi:anti-sigma factor RsiW